MRDESPCENEQVSNFVCALSDMPDHRDDRGKKKNLLPSVIIVRFVMAIQVGRSTTSSIHRYIRHKINWLRELTGHENAEPVSRAHSPRFSDRLDWVVLNDLIEQHFGTWLERDENEEWVAIDGKVLRGTIKGGDKQAVILAVTHDSREVIAQARQEGKKSSEIPVVRELLKNTELEKQKITSDAHHRNPLTTA